MSSKFLKSFNLISLKSKKINTFVLSVEKSIEFTFVKAFFFQYLTNNGNLNVTHALKKSVFGFGRQFSSRLHGILAFHPNARAKLVDRYHVSKLDFILRNSPSLLITDKLEYTIKANKRLYVDIHSYRGSRLVKGKPARGQSTRTNARTCKKLRVSFN